MAKIPEDLIVDVLSRLPVETLLRFRCVSKQWCALIDSPNFIHLQLNQSLKTNTNLSMIFEYDDLFSVVFDSLDDILKHGDDKVPPFFNFVEKTIKLGYHPLKSTDFRILGSCNGLICLLSLFRFNPILLNHSTKKYQILPPLPLPSPLFKSRFRQVYGFGYDPVNDDYKIVRVAECSNDYKIVRVAKCSDLSFHFETLVYSLRSNIWKRVQHKSPHPLKNSYCAVLFNGALHWFATRKPKKRVDRFIVAFDLVAEDHREVQLPNISDNWFVTLGVSGGCLWLGCICDFYIVELWVMKYYMVQESWTKHSLAFCSQVYRDPYSDSCQVRILNYSKSSSEVLLQINKKLLWLDLKQKTVVDLGIRSLGVEICSTSLV